eukprot:UN19868
MNRQEDEYEWYVLCCFWPCVCAAFHINETRKRAIFENKTQVERQEDSLAKITPKGASEEDIGTIGDDMGTDVSSDSYNFDDEFSEEPSFL